MSDPPRNLGPLATARDAADLLLPRFLYAAREKLVVLYVDRERRYLNTTEVEGSNVEVSLPVRVIIAAALSCDARGLILAHNHPSGDPTPSQADVRATRRLVEAAAPLGITVHDHLVFAGSECRSYRALGLL